MNVLGFNVSEVDNESGHTIIWKWMTLSGKFLEIEIKKTETYVWIFSARGNVDHKKSSKVFKVTIRKRDMPWSQGWIISCKGGNDQEHVLLLKPAQ